MYGHYYDIDYSNDPTIWYYQSHLLNTVEENKQYEEELRKQEEAYWSAPMQEPDAPPVDPNYFYRFPRNGWMPHSHPQAPHPPTHLPYIPPPPLYRGYLASPNIPSYVPPPPALPAFPSFLRRQFNFW